MRTGLVTLAGFIALAVTLQVSLAGVYRSLQPLVALKAAPYDAGARAKLAEQLASSGIDDQMEMARGLALDALRLGSIQPTALRVLGQLTATQEGARAEENALALMLASQRLSRRDLTTQMWLIDYHGRHGDVEAMVQQFDLALRASESSRSVIFPLLDAAAFDPVAREELIRTLSKRPNWAAPFASHSALYGTNLAFAVEVARMHLDPRKQEDRAKYSALVHRLVGGQHYELAWRVYNEPSLGPIRSAPAAIRNGNFEAAEDTFPFDWNYAQEAELWASRERLADRGSVLRLAAYNGRAGEVAWQLLHLTPGSHQFEARVGDIPAAMLERPEVRIECATGSNAGVLLSRKPTASGDTPHAIQGRFVVPPSCAFQRLSISVSGEGAQKDTLPWIDEVRVR